MRGLIASFTKLHQCSICYLSIVSVCADTQSYAAWRLEVTELLKSLLDQPSTAMVPQDFSRVGSTQANKSIGFIRD